MRRPIRHGKLDRKWRWGSNWSRKMFVLPTTKVFADPSMFHPNVPPRTLHLQSIPYQIGSCFLKNSPLFFSFERLNCWLCVWRKIREQTKATRKPAYLLRKIRRRWQQRSIDFWPARPGVCNSYSVPLPGGRGQGRGLQSRQRQPCIRVSQFPVCCSCRRAGVNGIWRVKRRHPGQLPSSCPH